MTKLAMIKIVSAIFVCVATFAGPCVAMPMRGLVPIAQEPSPEIQTIAQDCGRFGCWRWPPSYYDTPPHRRPRVFYGYEPHRHGDWFKYLYGRDSFGYGNDWYRSK